MRIATSITLDEEIIKKLEIKAEEENRNRSNMAEVILKEALKNIEIVKD